YETGHGQYRSSQSVLLVGELAWRILDHVAGGALRASGAGGPPTSGRPTRRRAAEAWFETIKARGEKAVLAEQVERGDHAARAAGGPRRARSVVEGKGLGREGGTRVAVLHGRIRARRTRLRARGHRPPRRGEGARRTPRCPVRERPRGGRDGVPPARGVGLPR